MGFFQNLFGGKSGVQAANNAAAAQQAANAQARNDLTSSYQTAQGRISPYAESGGRANALYYDAIGANGAEGYGRAKANFDADPFLEGERGATDLAIRGVFRRYNSQGMGNSGAAGAAVGRVGAERYGQQVADYRSRLAGAGQQGWQASNALASLDTGQGRALSENDMNVGNIEANRLMQGYGAQQQGYNNLLGLVGNVAGGALKFVTPTASGKSPYNALFG